MRLSIGGAAVALLAMASAGQPDTRAADGSAIGLGDMLAIELPRPEMTAIAPSLWPLKEVLTATVPSGVEVAHDQVAPLAPGATRVRWTSWSRGSDQRVPLSTRTAYVYVLPFGQAPVGISGDEHATGGNHSAKVVRDADGGIHMAWLDGGRPGKGFRVLYRRARQDPATGALHWDTDAIRVSDPATEAGNSYVALDAGEQAVHIAWHGGRTTRYRRLVRAASTWHFEPIRDTGAQGSSGDNGPDLAARGDHEVHVLSPTGQYAMTVDDGRSWVADRVPALPGIGMKNPALAVDRDGHVHVVFTATVRNATTWSSSTPNGGYWELRYVRREPGRGWVDAHNILQPWPEWHDARREWDVLADWSDVTVDAVGSILVSWHGTARTHIFGNDDAFVIRRPAHGRGTWGPWESPRPLHPQPPTGDRYHSFAPSLAVDATRDLAIAVSFFEIASPGHRSFGVGARLLRAGVVQDPLLGLWPRLSPGPLPPSGPGLSAWFPAAAPRLWHDLEGRTWLDVLYTLVPPPEHAAPNLIVYQREDVTHLVRGGTPDR